MSALQLFYKFPQNIMDVVWSLKLLELGYNYGMIQIVFNLMTTNFLMLFCNANDTNYFSDFAKIKVFTQFEPCSKINLIRVKFEWIVPTLVGMGTIQLI